MVVRAEGLGVPCCSGMFKQALHVVANLSEETMAAKVEYLKNLFRWSDAEVGVVVRSQPMVLLRSKETLQRKSEFLISEVGLVPAYIAHRLVMLGLSLEGRLRPRYYVMRFLKENGLLDRERHYWTIVKISENLFLEKYICPHKEAAPRLAEDYADACKGQVPTRFRFA
jgi:mTERF domain-containing protein, mitochondrial